MHLVSPHYPEAYPNIQIRETNITTNEDSIIVVEWEDFEIEFEKNCSFDKVIIVEEVCIYFPPFFFICRYYPF